MPPQTESTIRLASFLGVFVVLALAEWLLPRRKLTAKKWPRWGSNLALVVINTLAARFLIPMTAVAVAIKAEALSFGLLHQFTGGYWAKLVIAILSLDFVIYVQHVLFHKVPLFWRIHRVHHADLDLDVTSGLRFHTIEILLSAAIKLLAVFLLGASPLAVVILEVVLNATSMFNHSNLRLPLLLDRIVCVFLVTPDMHRVHHSIIPHETNSNYGFNVPWWDFLLGTYRSQPTHGHDGMTIGLENVREEKQACRLPGMIVLPFVRLAPAVQTPAVKTERKPPRLWPRFHWKPFLSYFPVFFYQLTRLSRLRKESREKWNPLRTIYSGGGYIIFKDEIESNANWIEKKLGVDLPGTVTNITVNQAQDLKAIIQGLGHHKELKTVWLNVALEDYEEDVLAQLQKLPKLKRVEISTPYLAATQLKHLCKNSALEELCIDLSDSSDFYEVNLDPALFTAIAHATNLRTLHLSTHANIKPNEFLSLSGHESLEEIQFVCFKLTDNALSNLAYLPNLKTLAISFAAITAQGLQGLAASGSPITKLVFNSARVNNCGIRVIEQFLSLEELRLDDAEITDDGFEHPERLTKLKFLYLSFTRVGDQTAAKLAGCPNLSHLMLDGSAVTDEGVASLARIPQLFWLDLRETTITDASLHHFHNHPFLKRLYLPVALLDSAGVKALKQALPRLHIVCSLSRLSPDPEN